MRFTVRRDGKTRLRELVVKPTGPEKLSYTGLRWAMDEGQGMCLPLRCDQSQQRGRVRLFYEIERCVSLRTHLMRTCVHDRDMANMLVDLAQAVARCMRAGHAYSLLLYDERHVFVDESARLRFIFVPLDGMAFREDGSPLALLRRLSDTSALRLATPDARTMADLLRTFVMEQEGAFSLNRYRAFVMEQTGVLVLPTGDVDRTSTRYEGSTNSLGGPDPSGGFLLHDLSGKRSFELAEGRAAILGRDPSCEVMIEGHANVSRRHASVCVRDGRVSVTDLGSTNGTFVGGRRIKPRKGVQVGLGQSFSLSGDSFCVMRTGKDVVR